MRTVLEVDKETAQRLRQLANAKKISIDQLLTAYIPGLASDNSPTPQMETEDSTQAFDEWVASFPPDLPPLSDDAISRASIYDARS
jgi:hypothetical protein